MDIDLNPAEPADFDALVGIWEAAVRATHHFLSEADIQMLKPLIRDQYLPAVTLVVARDNRCVAQGFLGYADGKVEMLFVAPDCHGLGIGKRLLSHAVRVLGASAVDVNEQNPAALAFYASQGFEVIRRSPLDGGGRPFPTLHMALASSGHSG